MGWSSNGQSGKVEKEQYHEMEKGSHQEFLQDGILGKNDPRMITASIEVFCTVVLWAVALKFLQFHINTNTVYSILGLIQYLSDGRIQICFIHLNRNLFLLPLCSGFSSQNHKYQLTSIGFSELLVQGDKPPTNKPNEQK